VTVRNGGCGMSKRFGGGAVAIKNVGRHVFWPVAGRLATVLQTLLGPLVCLSLLDLRRKFYLKSRRHIEAAIATRDGSCYLVTSIGSLVGQAQGTAVKLC